MKKLQKLLKKLENNNFLAIALTMLITSLLCLRLGRDYLFDWDEGIYAQLGVELLKTGKVFVNFWNQNLWLEKPPGISWLTSIGYTLFGKGEFAARFFMPIFAGITLYLTYLIGKKLKDKLYGFTALLVLANYDLFLSRARKLNTDGPLLTTITAAVYASLIKARPIFVSLIIFSGVWIKGVAGLLSLAIIAPLYIKRKLDYFKTVLYSILLSLPWHIFAYLKYGNEFINPYFKEQVVKRITTPIEFHLESKWFYFNFLYQNLTLATILLATLSLLIISYKTLKARKLLPQSQLVWWALLPLAIFTLAKTRLFWYLLPIYPAIALLVGYLIRTVASSKKARKLLIIFLFLYTITTVRSTLNYIDLSQTESSLTPRDQVATFLSGKGEIAVLVSKSERTAEAILPKDQRISSSFRYGGMPGFVYYANEKINFFYDTDKFLDFITNSSSNVVITQSDQQLVQDTKYQVIKKQNEYIILEKK